MNDPHRDRHHGGLGPSAPPGFTAVTEVEADRRGRVTLASAGARSGRRYRVFAAPDGRVVLQPVVSVPLRELRQRADPGRAREMREAVGETEAGRTVELGRFAQYLGSGDVG